MFYAIIGKPGEGKSYYAVTEIYAKQQENNDNVKKNSVIYYENKQILEDRGLLETFYDYYYELGNVKHERSDNHSYFQVFEDEEQFEEYFEYFLFYNKYIDAIRVKEGINLTNLLPVHQIYSNINGLKIDGVLQFNDGNKCDWTKTPLGSIHYIDEIRDIPHYKFDGRKPSQHHTVMLMSKVRHFDKDVYMITQDSEDLNYSLRKLIDKLYFVKRPPSKAKACGVYVFDQYLGNPRSAADSKRDPKKYIAHFILVYKKKYQNMYVSSSSHTSMLFNFPVKSLVYGLIFLVVLFVIVQGFLKIPIFSHFSNLFGVVQGRRFFESTS
ncbi:hypothetical protein [Acinetobacter puyangensis]|uniref:hypothetical protein n=1 Tax=Acinetobacter puyangensis TaxID=1096779 RepID=UPI003A4E5AC8